MLRQLFVLLLAAMLASMAPREAAADSIADLCAQLVNDPSNIPLELSSTGKVEGLKTPPYLDEDQKKGYVLLNAYKAEVLYQLRRVQVAHEMEAHLNLVELRLTDQTKGKVHAVLEKLRQKVRAEAEQAEKAAKSAAEQMVKEFAILCPQQTPPRVITLQPLPGLLSPGLALGGVVAAPLPPAGITPPSVTAIAFPDIAGTWYREGDRSKPATVAGSGENLTFTNEFKPPLISKGKFTSPTTVVATEWEKGLVGTLISDKSGRVNRINWGNGTSWQR
jgi:hypothetical protein